MILWMWMRFLFAEGGLYASRQEDRQERNGGYQGNGAAQETAEELGNTHGEAVCIVQEAEVR